LLQRNTGNHHRPQTCSSSTSILAEAKAGGAKPGGKDRRSAQALIAVKDAKRAAATALPTPDKSPDRRDAALAAVQAVGPD
jgi:hypothetical protein